MIGVLGNDFVLMRLHWAGEQPGLMRWIYIWITPQTCTYLDNVPLTWLDMRACNVYSARCSLRTYSYCVPLMSVSVCKHVTFILALLKTSKRTIWHLVTWCALRQLQGIWIFYAWNMDFTYHISPWLTHIAPYVTWKICTFLDLVWDKVGYVFFIIHITDAH